MPYNAINPPAQVRDKDAFEVMRVSVLEGEPFFALKRGFDDPVAWGVLFAEAARHVSRAYAHERMFTETEAIARIRTAFNEAISAPVNPQHVTEIEKNS
jgi:hypothetical protein